MLFQWLVKSEYDFVVHDEFVKMGTTLVGITHRYKHPNEVVLNKEELMYILKNPEYGLVICKTLTHPTVKVEEVGCDAPTM